MKYRKIFVAVFLVSLPLAFLAITQHSLSKTKAPSVNESKYHPYENVSRNLSTPPVSVNITFIEDTILKKDEIKSVIGDEFESISYEYADNYTAIKIFVQTPCADYSIKYDLVNDSVISIDKVYPWKKTIKEEPVSEEEKQRFLAVALNDSRVKEVLKGRDFSVSMVKYVMYMACQKARDPDSVHMTFKVNSEIYRVVLLPYNDKLRVVRVEKMV